MVESFVNLDNARHDEQRLVMERIRQSGGCPFDADNLHNYHRQPILRRGDHWLLTYNQWPYDYTSLHLLAIANTHVERLHELAAGAGEELLDHMRWAELEFRIAAGGIAMRFGDISVNGATVNHLHAHCIVPDAHKPPEEKVRFKIS